MDIILSFAHVLEPYFGTLWNNPQLTDSSRAARRSFFLVKAVGKTLIAYTKTTTGVKLISEMITIELYWP